MVEFEASEKELRAVYGRVSVMLTHAGILVMAELWSVESLVSISSPRAVRTDLRLIVIETLAAMLDSTSSDKTRVMAYGRYDKGCCDGNSDLSVVTAASLVFALRCYSRARLEKRQ